MPFRLSRPAHVVLLTLVLTGCAAVGPDYQAPAATAQAVWQTRPPGATDAAPADLGRWWTRLGDTQIDGLIAAALLANPDLAAAQARLRAARARQLQSEAALGPSVSARGSVSRSKNGEVAASNLYSAGFDAGWEIDLFGGKRRGVEAARADQDSAEASLQDAQVSLIAELALNVISLRDAQARLNIARANLAVQQETLQLVAWRVQAGLASAVDSEQARSILAQTQAQIPLLQTSVTEAAYRIEILLGRPPGALGAELAAVHPLPVVPAALALGIPADTLRQRPDVRAAERTLAAETARIGVAEAARYPSLQLSGSLGTDALTLGALGAAGTLSRTLSASLAGVLFDGGQLRQQVEAQKAVQAQALAAWRRQVLVALQDVENALVELVNNTARRDALQVAAQAAGNAATLARQRYQSGLIDFQTVLDTQRTLLSTQDSLASADAERVSTFIRLYKALGGGWQNSPPAATLSPAPQDRTAS
jgi:NodT family efflux transporter outer membrane factor (OMF) lipoprotein